MKIAVVGGSGKLGRGLAMRLSRTHSVLIGSRDESKGQETAKQLKEITGGDVTGGTNETVAKACEMAVLAIPNPDDFALLGQLRGPLKGKIAISPVVQMLMDAGTLKLIEKERSAAEEVASILTETRVVAAFHNLPAGTVGSLDRILDFDVLVACDDRGDYEVVSHVIKSIEGLRPLYVGPLSLSRGIEAITPLLINAAKQNGLRRLSVKLVS